MMTKKFMMLTIISANNPIYHIKVRWDYFSTTFHLSNHIYWLYL